MLGAPRINKVVLADFPTPILPKICGEPTRELLINIYIFISRSTASAASNLRGGRHRHLMLAMTAKEYMEQTGYAFVLPHNPGNYPPTMGTAQKQALRTERFRKNQALFIRYTTADRSLKKKIVTAVQPVFLYPLVYQITGFGQVSALTILQHIFTSYGAIDEINLEENAVKLMDPYDPT